MSIIIKAVNFTRTALRSGLSRTGNSVRFVSHSSTHLKEEEKFEVKDSNPNEDNETIAENADTGRVEARETNKDRSVPISPETSIRYMNSEAYKLTYGDDPVWKYYRRNYKGQFAPRKTRQTCIRGGVISTGNPCPICRDEYLVFDHRNIKLLKQFICEYSGNVLSYQKTGICQRKYKHLLIALYRAKEYGTIMFDVPLREYNYSDWYNQDKQTQ